MTKIDILSIEGKKIKEIDLPSYFHQPIREDLIFKVLETKKTKQPYSPSPVAGKQHSASGIVQHRRHVWKTSYGHGISRVPRKIMSRRGSRFNWVGAEISSTVGGRRAHPPKIISMINTKKINKKEDRIAFVSALSATANEKEVTKKYERLTKLDNRLPLIVESKITSLKIKGLIDSLKKILGDGLFEIAIPKRKIRAGKGKARGRKYKKNAGLLLVIGKDEKLKIKGIEVKNANNLSVMDLASGRPGRLTLYTENAIKNLDERIKK
ncbi:MAG: 50S ribosomal protein L4 [Nanoarchaeota archaeon]|nr:50S ribosomal protein L4 [Nanoarchaeota archaeon]